MNGFEGYIYPVSAVVPINLGAGANDGDWISLKGFKGVTVVFFKGAGGAAEPPTLTMEQATNVAAGSAKALTFTRINVNQRADLTAASGDAFTVVTQAAAQTYAFGSGADGDKQCLAFLDIDASSLDVENGFDCIRARVADVGDTSQIGCLLYFLWGPRYSTPASPIAN